MPIYEYRCEKCGREVEVLQHRSPEAAPECDACGGTMKRMISATSFILKGEGWYVTDYPSKDRKAGLEAEKKGGAKKTGPEKAPGKGPREKAGSGSRLSEGKAKRSRKTRPPRKT